MTKRKNQNREATQEVVNEVAQEVTESVIETPAPEAVVEAPVSTGKTRGRKPYAGLTEAKFAKAAKAGETLDGMEYITPDAVNGKVSQPYFQTSQPLAEIDENGMFHAFSLHTEGWSRRTVRTDLKVMAIADVLALVTATE